ncbi:MAG: DegV family EDD domain-containing protein [Spirochaetales bacterium]|nr:DegV family EDD domain-containing protein [Spirochaetales bacterium]
MQISYLDGSRLGRGLVAGARRLIESAGFLDRINVFPVADGDTGANMAATVVSMSGALSLAAVPSIGAVARQAADAALEGSRGNSGAILAEFFQGLAEDLAAEARVGTRRFAEAVVHAAAAARVALSFPKEGTIITVLHDWAASVHRIAQSSDDFIVLFRESLKAARASLERTTNLLPELKKAGVVDAGAMGFVRLVEGICQYMQHGHLRDSIPGTAGAFDVPEPEWEEPVSSGGQAPTYRYCVEAQIAGTELNPPALREALAALGDSVVVAGSRTRIKAHVHSDHPAKVFGAMAAFGTVERQKADDMRLQLLRAAAGHRRCAVVVDSACDVPDADCLRLGVETVPVQVIVHGESLMDGIGLSSDDFVEYLAGKPEAYPTTSQPGAASFARKYDLALGYADDAVYIGISERLSGTLEAGRRAAAASRNAARLHVVDTRQISVAAGLVARKAAEVAAMGAGVDEVMAAAEAARRSVKLLVVTKSLDGLLRSGRLKGLKGLAARALGINPILTIKADGAAGTDGVYFGKGNGFKAVLKRVASYLAPGAALEAIIGHVDAPKEAQALADELSNRYTVASPIGITTISPALAAHAGLGTVVLGFLTPEPKA